MNHLPHHINPPYATPSTCRSEFEATNQAFDPSLPSSPTLWTPSSTSSRRSSLTSSSPIPYRDPLRSVHGSPRVRKPSLGPSAHLRSKSPPLAFHDTHSSSTYLSENGASPEELTSSPSLHTSYPRRSRHPSSPPSSSPPVQHATYRAPRSDRLPSLFERIKSALEAPKRPKITIQPLPPIRIHQQQPSLGMTSDSSSIPLYPSLEESLPSTLPTLFGIQCSAASERAYSGHGPDLESALERLQREDKGMVEHRTIAFSTHLTISRWEPAVPSASAKDLRNDPAHAARLMALANYIRHIVTLTAGRTTLHASSSTLCLPAKQGHGSQLCTKPLSSSFQPWSSTTSSQALYSRAQAESASLPSPLSAGPGPLKSESFRRHRYSSEYHDHATRRMVHHQHQYDRHPKQRQELSTHAHSAHPTAISPESTPQQFSYRMLPSPTSPTFQHQRSSAQGSSIARENSPLLSVPYPNLTLTLALIYVDRLRAKYPEAKGEPGCSHRLFLVAYIIAAKYRCSVELSSMLLKRFRQPVPTNSESNHDNQSTMSSDHDEKAIWEARSKAQLTLSNQEWIRLLNLGSFFRSPSPTTASASTSSSSPPTSHTSLTSESGHSKKSMGAGARTCPTQPLLYELTAASLSSSPLTAARPSNASPEAKPLPIQSFSPPLAGVSTPAPMPAAISSDAALSDILSYQQATQTLKGSVSITPAISSPSSILQVQDLDRMEAEFLTFLEFDLSTRSQDLDTCWNLLIGNKP